MIPAGDRHRYLSWASCSLKCQWNVCLAEALGRGIATVRLVQKKEKKNKKGKNKGGRKLKVQMVAFTLSVCVSELYGISHFPLPSVAAAICQQAQCSQQQGPAPEEPFPGSLDPSLTACCLCELQQLLPRPSMGSSVYLASCFSHKKSLPLSPVSPHSRILCLGMQVAGRDLKLALLHIF